jgi:hypothetical protein
MWFTGLLVFIGACISLIGPPALPPNGPIFQMLQLFVLAALFGQVVSKIIISFIKYNQDFLEI